MSSLWPDSNNFKIAMLTLELTVLSYRCIRTYMESYTHRLQCKYYFPFAVLSYLSSSVLSSVCVCVCVSVCTHSLRECLSVYPLPQVYLPYLLQYSYLYLSKWNLHPKTWSPLTGREQPAPSPALHFLFCLLSVSPPLTLNICFRSGKISL